MRSAAATLLIATVLGASAATQHGDDVLRIWKVGSPFDERVPREIVPGYLSDAAQRAGLPKGRVAGVAAGPDARRHLIRLDGIYHELTSIGGGAVYLHAASPRHRVLHASILEAGSCAGLTAADAETTARAPPWPPPTWPRTTRCSRQPPTPSAW